MSEVIREEGRYVLREGAGEAEIVVEPRGPGVIAAVHTFVPEALRGKGLAERLLAALLEDARAEGFRIVPQCPWVAAQARRHPEWAGLFTSA